MLPLQKLFHCIVFLLLAGSVYGQEAWPSPEVAEMYRHAREYVAAKNYNDAIITLKHAIALAPRKMVLYKDLANALYATGKYSEAEKVLSSIDDMPDADAECYDILAASRRMQGDSRGALAALKKGLSLFPSSGLLYHEKGIVYKAGKRPDDALDAWLSGINKEPAYAANYYDAAIECFNSQKIMWGLLYGEIYLNIASDTIGFDDLKGLLFSGYKNMFDNINKGLPEYGTAKNKKPDNFIDAVEDIYSSLTPVISDGITTESLTMVRTRFLMDWFTKYNSIYPFTLFAYWDKLVRTGHVDIYNEWLFGKAESEIEFKAWNTFHEGDLERFRQWKNEHNLQPLQRDFYAK